MAALGALIVSNETITDVLKAGLSRSSFFYPPHIEIFDSIHRLHAASTPIDLVTVKDDLALHKRLESAGGVAYLASIVETVPNTSMESALAYTSNLLEISRRRLAALAARRFADACSTGNANGELHKLREAIEGLEGKSVTEEPSRPKTLEELRALAMSIQNQKKIPLGLPGVDEVLGGGSLAGHFVTVGAFSGQGKTTVCVHQAVHKAKLGHPVMFITTELGEIELGAKVEAGFDDPYESLPTLRIWFPEGDILSIVREILAWAEPHKGADLCPVVIIDYLQKLRPPEGIENRERQVAVVCEELQRLGRRHGILLIVAAQLNRRSQEDKPALHHLRESGMIEQVSDLAIMVAKPSDEVLWTMVAKNRWGRSGFETEIAADYSRSRFGELPPEIRYRELAESIRTFLAGEKEGQAKVRDVCRAVRWGKDRPSREDIQEASAACGGFLVSGSVVALLQVRQC